MPLLFTDSTNSSSITANTQPGVVVLDDISFHEARVAIPFEAKTDSALVDPIIADKPVFGLPQEDAITGRVDSDA